MVPIAFDNKNLTLRQAYLNDLDSLVEVARKTFFETYYLHFKTSFSLVALNQYMDTAFSLAQIKTEYMRPDSQFYVLKEGSVVVGYLKISGIDITSSKINSEELILDRIYLTHSLQGHGIGQQLLNFVFQKAKHHHKKLVRLQCWADHKKSLNFYQSHGFKIIDKITFPIEGTTFEDTDYILEKEI